MKKIILFSIVAILLVGKELLSQTSFGNTIVFDGNGDYANTLNVFFPQQEMVLWKPG